VNWWSMLIGILRRMLDGLRADSSASSTETQQNHCQLTREDVLRLIAQHGGPQGLDLSSFDLSGINLADTDLRGAIFGKYKHGSANLQDTFLEGANLEGADLAGTNLQNANLHDSVLRETTLNWANLQNTDLRGSDLTRATLFRARLEGADLSNAEMRYTNLHLAFFGNTKIDRDKLGEFILQENTEEYRRHLEDTSKRLGVDIKVEQHLAKSMLEAKDVYLCLKNNFRSIGQYDDASWAYIKERQMGKRTHWPPRRARDCYPAELDRLPSSGLRRRWQLLKFSIKHLLAYITDWIAELACGYGEKPLRTLGWAFVVIFAFPIFYRLSGGVISVGGMPLTWLDYLNYSFGAFTTIGFSNFATVNPLAQILTSVEALLGISVLALLMFALGNRISRS
jgi:uncharacterized protein YjbI with pentapeptide repeats